MLQKTILLTALLVAARTGVAEETHFLPPPEAYGIEAPSGGIMGLRRDQYSLPARYTACMIIEHYRAKLQGWEECHKPTREWECREKDFVPSETIREWKHKEGERIFMLAVRLRWAKRRHADSELIPEQLVTAWEYQGSNVGTLLKDQFGLVCGAVP